MFSKAKVGDKVFDYTLQEWGKITAIRPKNCTYPIKVLFNTYGIEQYTVNGKNLLESVVPVLFWDEVEPITPPKKPLPSLAVDTCVLVWGDDDTDKQKRYFSHFDSEGNISCFERGATSWSSDGNIVLWDNWELVE